MKNHLLLIALLTAGAAWGGIPNGAAWEVRTGGSDLNGAFFNTLGGSGTDYSQQDAAQLSVTDGATATTTLSSVTGGFTSAMVHNGVQLSGGTCTAGFYEITAFTNTNTVTIDRTGGTGTGCTAKVGGGLLTIQTAATNMGQVNHCYIKAGTYTITSTITLSGTNFTGGGANGAPVFEGYSSTHGDLGTKPLITTSTNSVVIFTFSSNPHDIILRNLSLSSTAGTRGDGLTTTGAVPERTRLEYCLLDGFNRGIYGDHAVVWGFGNLSVVQSEIKNSVSHAIENTFGTNLIFNYLHNNGGAGFHNGTAVATGIWQRFEGNVFYANNYGYLEGVAEQANAVFTFRNNVFSDNTLDGIKSIGGMLAWEFQNNVFYNNGAYGVDYTSSGNNNQGIYIGANAYGANGTAPTLNFPTTGNITLTADPFTARTSNNFSLNSTTGGGALLKAAGYPGTITNVGTGYVDVGALQSQGAATGGAAFAYVQ